ncbi:MAG: hypothetical protein Tsb009_18970 [Planctomycetaceae bacterium]
MKRIPLFIILLLVSGCGTETYRERLERTSRYYAFLDVREKNLSEKRWSSRGVSLHVPKQFKLIWEANDSRNSSGATKLPRRLRSLPGVAAIWRADVAVEGEIDKFPVFLVAMSNRHSKHQSEHTPAKAHLFQNSVVQQFYHMQNKPAPRNSDWRRKSFPESSQFSIPLEFAVFESDSDFQFPRFSVDYQLRLYSHTNAQGHVSLLVISPSAMSDKEKLTDAERIGWMLETVRVSPSD